MFEIIIVARDYNTSYSICTLIKCWLSGLDFSKCLSEKQTGQTMIRLLCLSRPVMQVFKILEHLPF